MIPYYEPIMLLTQVCFLTIFTNSSLTATPSQATKKLITTIPIASAKDVDVAVEAASAVSSLTLPSLLFDLLNTRMQQAYKDSWASKCPGAARGKLLAKLADLVEKHADELAALEALNVGQRFLFHSPPTYSPLVRNRKTTQCCTERGHQHEHQHDSILCRVG